jgi:hypothetical protein
MPQDRQFAWSRLGQRVRQGSKSTAFGFMSAVLSTHPLLHQRMLRQLRRRVLGHYTIQQRE